MPEVYGLIDTARKLALTLNKPVVYLGGFWTQVENEDLLDPLEIWKAAPILSEADIQATADGHAFVVCHDEEEMYRIFNSIVGDDGPTESNPYSGPARVYALAINAYGESISENT